MIHLQNTKPYTPTDATLLLRKARELVGYQGVVIRDTRVSKKYLEFDTSIPDDSRAGDVVGRLARISPLASYEHILERHMDKEEAISRALQLFNDEKYWGAHEALEGVWKASAGDEKSMLNGIILVAAAFVHDEKGEQEVCLSILKRAVKKLNGASGTYHGIDLRKVVMQVAKILDTGKVERFTI
jgi:hypothetical protein